MSASPLTDKESGVKDDEDSNPDGGVPEKEGFLSVIG
jgi:hypothetical protein